MLKQLFGWAMTGFRPKCDTCGRLLDVKRIDFGGTLYECSEADDEAHKKHREMYKRWRERIEALEAEFDKEDNGQQTNYARQHYGKIKIEVRRKAD